MAATTLPDLLGTPTSDAPAWLAPLSRRVKPGQTLSAVIDGVLVTVTADQAGQLEFKRGAKSHRRPRP